MDGFRHMRPMLAALALGAALSATAHAAGRPAARAAASHKGQSWALPFIEDDYPRAVAEAKARKVPLFVEAWAPW